LDFQTKVSGGSSVRTPLKMLALLFVVLAVASVSVVSTEAGRTQAAPRPNIILVLTDDQSANTLPHMPYVGDEFQDNATTYPNATYNFPLCCPSRVSILRGQYTHNHGVWSNSAPDGGYVRAKALNIQDEQIARWLDSVGYQTGMFGKYINGYSPTEDPKPLGWDRFVLNGYNYDGTKVDPSVYPDEVVKDNALRWLKKSLPGKPLFMWVGFQAPHQPFNCDPIYSDRFTNVRLPNPPSFNEKKISEKPQYVSNQPRLTDEDIVKLMHVHRDRLRGLLTPDNAVRKIVDTLKAAGELGNTYIVFWSDNGFMTGEHRLRAKRHAYVESVSFPMIVRGPNLRSGESDPRIVMNQDLAPTFADLANAPLPAFADGRSMVPIFDGDGPWRDVGLIEALGTTNPGEPPTYQGLRHENYIYVQYSTGEHEYYDLQADPYQLANAYTSLDGVRKAALRKKTRALAECAGVTCRSLEE
jgi:N-acetylglucosamine-6-sulfatase